MRLSYASWVVSAFLVPGCGPGVASDGGGASASAGTETEAETEAETNVADDTTVGVETDPGAPTDTDQPPPADICAPLDVEEGNGWAAECDPNYVYAWNGIECEQICECQGPHCDLVSEDAEGCFEGRWDCPAFTQMCPMREGTVMVSGLYELTTGVFGIRDDTLYLDFAADDLALASWTHLRFASYEPWGQGLGVWLPAVDGPGEYPVTGWLFQEPYEETDWTGTLTITDLELDGEPGTWRMSGSLTIANADRSFEGEFTGLPGCAHLSG